jgi:hypothetical protein
MTSLLSNYNYQSQRPKLAGQIINLTLSNRYSAVNATEAVPFGCVLKFDTTNSFAEPSTGQVVTIPTATTDKIAGISFLEYIYEGSDYPINSAFPYATLCDIVVFSETINTIGDPVFVRVLAGVGGTKIGYGFRNVAVSGETIALPNCYWTQTNTTTNEVSVIHFER